MNDISGATKIIFVFGILLSFILISIAPKVIAQGTANVFISDIDYDPIADPLEEFVEITNGQPQSVDMTDWVLGDDNGNIYTFPSFALAAGNSVRVWTGSGTNNTNNLYWGRSEPVWDDVSECAYLRDGLGIDSNLIDSLCYPGPSIQFALANYSVHEDAVTATATISVTLSSPASTVVSVDYQTSDGTATSGSDYIAASDTLTFTVGETSQTFDVTIVDDGTAEPNEIVNLALSNPTGGILGTVNTAMLMIIDDDGAPTIQFEPISFIVGEADGSATIKVTLSHESTETITVDYSTADGTATAGDDYNSTSGTLTFVPSDVEETFTITILDDTQDEPDETVSLQLSNPTGDAGLGVPGNTATLTIIDNDEPQPTPTNTPTSTNTPTHTPTFTPSPTSTFTPTHSPTLTQTSTQTPTQTNTLTPTSTPVPSSTPSSTPTEPTGRFVYAPMILSLKMVLPTSTPTPTLTPTLTPTSTATPTSTPVRVVCNGDFEQGRICWLESSTQGFELVTNDFQGAISPHSGSWGAWLGGEDNETSIIYQQVIIPTGSPKLYYWYWIGSEDVCGYDVGGVVVNEDAVDGFWLCTSTNTGGWAQRVVDLSAYAGQTVTLYILADTDSFWNSNLFIDDVQIQ